MKRELGISQIARLTRMSRNTIRAWMNSGRLSCETRDGQRVVPLAEVLRVFPDLDGQAIEQELNGTPVKRTPESAPQNGQAHEQDGGQASRIAALEALVEHQRVVIAMLNEQVNSLKADKELLTELIKARDGQVDQLVGRLIPAKSSAGRSAASTQPRDGRGRFSGSGRGVDALLQGSLVDEGQAHGI